MVHMDSVVLIVLLKKVNKQIEEKLGILSWITDQRTKSREQGNSLKVVKQGRLPIPADILVDI